MQRVTGIGGVFFAAMDAEALQRWYAEHLGVEAPPPSYDEREWQQQAGPTVFAAFGPEHHDSPHLGPRGFGVNFRVGDLDAMVDQLRRADITVEVDPDVYPNGHFASLHDPEGNPVQLWQPR
jgi:glyoxylase I family protein